MNNVLRVVNDIAALRLVSPTERRVMVMGYETANDGGGGVFCWTEHTPQVADDDGMVFASALDTEAAHGGRWHRVTDGGAVSVRWFGARGDGVRDDTGAVQRAIDYATGGGAPATTVRYARAAVYLPAGTYSLQDGVAVRSVAGFHLYGDGPRVTVLRVACDRHIDSLVEVDGAKDCLFENFSLETERGLDDPHRGRADKMFHLRKSPQVLRSTSNNTIRNVHVGDGRNGQLFRIGFAVGVSDPVGEQCDGTIFQSCLVTGTRGQQMTSPDTAEAWSQCGWELGNGGHGNNLNHMLYGCSWAHVRRGVFMNATNAMIYGAQCGAADVDFYIAGVATPVLIEGVSSEHSNRLLVHSGGIADGHLTMRCVRWAATDLAIDGAWIDHSVSGYLGLEDIQCMQFDEGTNPRAIVRLSPAGGRLSCVAKGVSTCSPVESAFELEADVWLTVMSYHQRARPGDHTIVAVTPFKLLGPGLSFVPS